MSRMCPMLVGVVVCCWLTSGANSENGNGDIVYPDAYAKRSVLSQNYMHDHYHHDHDHDHFDHDPEFHKKHPEIPFNSPDFHHNHDEDEDDFPEEDPGVNKRRRVGSNTSQIPVNFIQDINQNNLSDSLFRYLDSNQYNVSDLLLDHVEIERDLTKTTIENRFSYSVANERDGSIPPKAAPCMPELQTVKIATSDDPSILYIPQCTRVERCGGCCSHALLSCQPEETEDIHYRVIKTQYTGGKKLKVLDKEIFKIEKHLKCKCDCRIKAEDCKKYQEYRKSECRCACTNHDEEKKCNKNNETKLWNPDLCACQCRETMQCSTGSYFDQNDCKCTTNRRFNSYQKRSNRYRPLPVLLLNEEY